MIFQSYRKSILFTTILATFFNLLTSCSQQTETFVFKKFENGIISITQEKSTSKKSLTSKEEYKDTTVFNIELSQKPNDSYEIIIEKYTYDALGHKSGNELKWIVEKQPKGDVDYINGIENFKLFKSTALFFNPTLNICLLINDEQVNKFYIFFDGIDGNKFWLDDPE